MATVVITGANRGMGLEFVKQYLAKGDKVIALCRNTSDELSQTSAKVIDKVDVGSPECLQKILPVLSDLKIDLLINNAGYGRWGQFGEFTRGDYAAMIQLNVTSLTDLCHLFMPAMVAKGEGGVINIGSSAATAGFPSGSVYCASKFALRGLTECWRHELRRENIRVMLINPSEVTTAFNNKKRLERDNEPKKLTPDEIAHAIVSAIRMDDRGFIPELNVWATNPF